MKYYVLEDGRILNDISKLEEKIDYIIVDKYPETKYENNKIGTVVGIENGKIKYEFREPIICNPEPVFAEPTQEELYQAEMMLMQAEILEKLNAMEV